MTEIEVIGWRHLPYSKQLHYFKCRSGMTQAVGACWIVSDRKSLKQNDSFSKCGLCEIMKAYHEGYDWYTGES